MQPSSIHSIYFSPTGTSRKIASAVAGAIACGNTIEDMDLTHDPVREHAFDGNAVAVIAVPVYGGAVAPTAMERLRKVSGQSTPAVIVVLYGNRAFGKAAVVLPFVPWWRLTGMTVFPLILIFVSGAAPASRGVLPVPVHSGRLSLLRFPGTSPDASLL